MTNYKISQDEQGQIGTAPTLYQACKKIVGVVGGNVVFGSRLVAFWCGHEKKVKAGFGALPNERIQIGQDIGLFS